jgi:hypothetical protein
MPGSKIGEEFITHEFDEAISIHRAIVQAERSLAESHPHAGSKRAIQAALRDDVRALDDLERLGKPRGATGKVEDVAEGVIDLLRSMVAKAGEAPSEAYEAHAVLLNAKRKQQDSAGGMVRIARAVRDTQVRDAAVAFGRMQRRGSTELSRQLAAFAAIIASADDDQDARRRAAVSRTSSSTRASSGRTGEGRGSGGGRTTGKRSSRSK